MRGPRFDPKTFGLRAQHADHCPIGKAVVVLKSTSLPIVSSVGRALEHARRAVLLVNAIVLAWSSRGDRVGFAGDGEIVGGVVVKGAVTAVAATRSDNQRKGIVEVGSERVCKGIRACV